MTESEALAKSTGYFNCPGGKGWLTGYLSFGVANTLLETGKYSVYRADCWGYILESKEKP